MSLEDTANKIRVLGKFKPNPYHYIIIDKWNRKEYNKVKSKIFNLIEEEIDRAITQNWGENFAKFASFPSTIEKSIDFWELYKKQLPLWSNINTNCYVKLKEN